MNVKGPGLSLPDLTLYTICQSFQVPALETLVLVRGVVGKAVIFHSHAPNILSEFWAEATFLALLCNSVDPSCEEEL